MSHNLRYRLSHAVENTGRPPIPQAYAWAQKYNATPARPLLDMSQGAPGIHPPKVFLDTLSRTSSDPRYCGYVPNAGEPVLRKAVVKEMRVAYGEDVDLSMDDVAITAGCNLAFAATIMTIAEFGDEVILPVPWYFNNEMTLTSLGIKPVVLETLPEDNFLPSPRKCEELITPKTKAIVLITPNNPTGAIYPPSLIASFATLARSKNIALIIDETYRDFLPADIPPHYLFNSPKSYTHLQQPSTATTLPSDWSWRETFIHLFSFSKSYCIPGHRVGLICASPALMPLLNIALDNIQICAPRPPQIALASLFETLRPFVRENAEAVKKRHELFAALLRAQKSGSGRWEVGTQGGYYAFVKHPFRGVTARDVCERLAVEMGVISLPAGFFCPVGGEQEKSGAGRKWIRFSVANIDDEKIRLVCERLEESIEKFGWALGE